MTSKPAASFTGESATALLALVGVQVDPSRANGIAATLNAQVGGARKAFANVEFETEPATYLAVSAKEAP
jgi:hypothetical protein